MSKQITIRKQYVKYPRVQTHIDPASGRTHQEFKDECDINNLLRHVARTGMLPDSFLRPQPQFIDASSELDFQTLADLRARADQQYALLPQDVRDVYRTPMAYFEALADGEFDAPEAPGTVDSLDVTVPGDTTLSPSPSEPNKKGVSNAPKPKKTLEESIQEVVHAYRNEETPSE